MAFLMSLPMFAPFIAPSPLITLSSGTFRGLSVNGTDRWLGIAYAQPPLGPVRFEAPVPISLLLVDVQDALKFSHACPRPHTTSLISEDCLYLNVWGPPQTSSSAKLPVLVWIYGAHITSAITASDPAFDGTRM